MPPFTYKYLLARSSGVIFVDDIYQSVQQFLENCMRKAAEEISAEIRKDPEEVYKELREIPVEFKDEASFAQYEYVNQVVEMNLKPIITLQLVKSSPKIKGELNKIYDVSIVEDKITEFIVGAYKNAYNDRTY